MLLTVSVTCLVTFVLSVVYASYVEWALHRYVMHKELSFFSYPFKAHAQTHHKLFGADATYHCTDMAIAHKITMAWWNGPILILIGALPFYLVAAPFAWFGLTAVAVTIVTTSIATLSGYYATYEYTHYCMHLPRARRIEFWWPFRRLNGHHVLHHKYMGKHNFNVVLPLADLTLGTLLVKSKRPFDQVRGPSVPDLQPV